MKTVYRYTIDFPNTPDRLDREIPIGQVVTQLKGTIVSVEPITLPPEVGDVVTGEEAVKLPEGTVVVNAHLPHRPRIVNQDEKFVGTDGLPYRPPRQGQYRIVYIIPRP